MKTKYTYAICYYHFEDEEFCIHHHIHIVAEYNIEVFKQYCNQRHIIIDHLDTIYADHKLTETFHK